MCFKGQKGFCLCGGSSRSRGCLWGTNRGHTLQSGGGLIFLEPGSHMESGMWMFLQHFFFFLIFCALIPLKRYLISMLCLSFVLKLFCSMSATFTLNFFRSGINFSKWGSFQLPGLLNFGEFKVMKYRKTALLFQLCKLGEHVGAWYTHSKNSLCCLFKLLVLCLYTYKILIFLRTT